MQEDAPEAIISAALRFSIERSGGPRERVAAGN